MKILNLDRLFKNLMKKTLAFYVMLLKYIETRYIPVPQNTFISKIHTAISFSRLTQKDNVMGA